MTRSLTGNFAARWIVPVSAPPIYGGWLRVVNDQIQRVESTTSPPDCVDLGDVAILPGLVNCHTHLEFSDLTEPLGRHGNALPDWIAAVVQHRSDRLIEIENLLSESTLGDVMQYTQQQRIAALWTGCEESLDAGVRLLGDIVTHPWLGERELQDSPLQFIAFAETLGLLPGRADQTFAAAEKWLSNSAAHGARSQVQYGISPHAPYSTSAELIDRCVQHAVRHHLPLAMHIAESRDELELLDNGSGRFREILMKLGAWQPNQFPHHGGLDEIIDRLLVAPRVLLVHGNYLTDQQILRISGHPHASVVFCPRTHAYFQHDPYPLKKFLDAGVRVGLGTDSRSSNPDLRLWSEARHTWNSIPDVPIETVLKMATMWGADALGRRECGRIAAGCSPGLLTVPAAAQHIEGLWQSIADSDAVHPL